MGLHTQTVRAGGAPPLEVYGHDISGMIAIRRDAWCMLDAVVLVAVYTHRSGPDQLLLSVLNALQSVLSPSCANGLPPPHVG